MVVEVPQEMVAQEMLVKVAELVEVAQEMVAEVAQEMVAQETVAQEMVAHEMLLEVVQHMVVEVAQVVVMVDFLLFFWMVYQTSEPAYMQEEHNMDWLGTMLALHFA